MGDGGARPGKRAGPHGALCVPLCSQNPDIVLVHYLNVPALEDCGKGCSPIFCSVSSDRREWLKWSREELLGQLKPMCKALPGGEETGASRGAAGGSVPPAWGERFPASQAVLP